MSLKMVEVEKDEGEGCPGPRSLREHPLHRVRNRALVGKPGESVGSGAKLCNREVPQVCKHGGSLTDGFSYALLFNFGKRA
jgi:hypothetical protein